METLEQLYRYNVDLLTQLDIQFTQWQHEPILDFATDILVAKRLGWTGTHSKSLFLKLKGGGYALYLTEKDNRLDGKLIKSLLGKRPSVCGDREMTEQLGCVPGAVCPFGIPAEIPIIVDTGLYQTEELLYTPAKPEFTIGFSGSYLKRLLNHIENRVFELST
jgi:Ala-tRNA(Pro) deacylase